MKKSIFKENYGITLITLIITVVVLLILLGVSIGIVVDDGLFEKAKNTVKEANNQINNVNNQESQIQMEWETLPGSIKKSSTKS